MNAGVPEVTNQHIFLFSYRKVQRFCDLVRKDRDINRDAIFSSDTALCFEFRFGLSLMDERSSHPMLSIYRFHDPRVFG